METASIDKQREEKNGKKLTPLDVLVFVLPMSMFIGNVQFTSLQITLPTILCGAIFILIVLNKSRNPEARAPASQKRIIVLLLGVLVFFLFMSNIQNYPFYTALQKIIGFSKDLLFFLVIFLYIQTDQDLELVGKAFFVTGVLVAVTMVLAGLNIVHFTYGQVGISRLEALSGERVSGILGSFGESTLLFAWVLSTSLSKFFIKKNGTWVKTILFLCTIGVLGAEIIFAQSRNALVTLLVVIFIFLILTNSGKKDRSTLLIAVGVFLFSFGLIALILWFDDIANFLNFFFISLGGQRLILYKLVLTSIGKNWIIGNGIGSFQEEFAFSYDVHNVFLQILNWGGVVSTAIFVLLWVFPFVKFISSNRGGHSPQQVKTRNLYWMMSIATMITIQFFVALSSGIFLMMWGAISTIPYLRPAPDTNTIEEPVSHASAIPKVSHSSSEE